MLASRKSESQAGEARQSISLSPEKDRYYSTRGSPFPFEGNGFDFSGGVEEKGTAALPRFFISLSNKEKEEDFMAMKGCKLPQRPKKRPKLMQKCLLVMFSFISENNWEVLFFHRCVHAHFLTLNCWLLLCMAIDGVPRSMAVRFVAREV